LQRAALKEHLARRQLTHIANYAIPKRQSALVTKFQIHFGFISFFVVKRGAAYVCVVAKNHSIFDVNLAARGFFQLAFRVLSRAWIQWSHRSRSRQQSKLAACATKARARSLDSQNTNKWPARASHFWPEPKRFARELKTANQELISLLHIQLRNNLPTRSFRTSETKFTYAERIE
jgi:isopenicillin N synthase-like dioxygenase